MDVAEMSAGCGEYLMIRNGTAYAAWLVQLTTADPAAALGYQLRLVVGRRRRAGAPLRIWDAGIMPARKLAPDRFEQRCGLLGCHRMCWWRWEYIPVPRSWGPKGQGWSQKSRSGVTILAVDR